jgi:ubiquinone/menaquinone biosynthesis C-methylase UbiE
MPFLDHFGLIAPYYDRMVQKPQVEKLIKYVDLPVTGLILDAGGGTGRVGEALACQASRVVIVDLSTKMLQQARSKDGLDLVCSFTEKLPFNDESFERVLMVDALHHVINQAESIHELLRVAKRGGRVVIVEPDARRLAGKLVALGEKLLLMRSHFLTAGQISELFGENAIPRIVDDGFNVWVTVDKR